MSEVRQRGHWAITGRRTAASVTLKAAELIAGGLFLSPPGQWLWRRALGAAPRDTADLPTAIVAHVFYPELLGEVLACRAAIPGGADLIVTTAPAKIEELQRRLADVPRSEVHAFENRGRDIAPFLMLLNSGRLDRYEAVLKLHTKKSPHLVNGGMRRRLLYTCLAGDAVLVARVLALFADPRTGIVGWRLAWRSRPSFWMTNRARVEELARRMSPPAEARLGFFEGSMFWVRPRALSPLRALRLDAASFEPEAGQTDGAMHHALERAFSIAAAAAGYETRSTSGHVLLR